MPHTEGFGRVLLDRIHTRNISKMLSPSYEAQY